MEIIENVEEFQTRFARWKSDDSLAGYPWISNKHAPITPFRRALPMLNLGLISSAGAYIDGTNPFDLDSRDGDLDLREIPREVEAADLRYAAKGYDPAAVESDRNAQIPIDRLTEYESNAVIGALNECWWSISSHIPNAANIAETLAPRIAERLARYEVQTALLIPASKLCHQTLAIIARGIEQAGISTILISVDKAVSEQVRAPRTAYYDGELGSVAGVANWREHQLRILDETLRGAETFDQPGIRKLAVAIETQVEAARGER
ncbi:MAG: glycine/sarcosine/betaine reductase selenoprotein B family protein [Pyrinomonadaceae bacterium]